MIWENPMPFPGEDNIGHFYGHAKLSTQMAIDILKRLKADNTTIAKVERFVECHDTPIENDDVIIKRLNKFGKEDFFDLIKLNGRTTGSKS